MVRSVAIVCLAIVIYVSAEIFEAKESNLITWQEFNDSLVLNQYPEPNQEKYDTVMRLAKEFGIDTKQELAMFLAQVYYESVGLQHKKEIACAKTKCPANYRTGKEPKGKYYYGRGYIQLTWIENYANCSLDLYGDLRLVDNPDLVSDTEEGAWMSAFWYWNKYVHDISEIHDGKFGFTTMAINGPLECKGPFKIRAFKRFVIYAKVFQVFDLKFPAPKQDGCYPMEGDDAPSFVLCKAKGFYAKQAGMYHWCNDNCNSEHPNCPEEMCMCEESKTKILQPDLSDLVKETSSSSSLPTATPTPNK